MERSHAALACALTLSMVALTACASSDSDLTDGERITVAIKSDQPRLSTSGSGSHSEGFEVELADAFDDGFGTGERYTPYEFDAGEQDVALGTEDDPGNPDVVIASYSITPDRLGKYDMVGPYMRSGLGVLVRTGDDVEIESPADLKDAENSVCTTSGQEAREQLKHSAVSIAANFDDCVTGLVDDEYSAVVADEIILRGFARDPEFEGKVKLAENITSGADVNNYGIAIRKDQHELCSKIKDWLIEYVDGNEWDDNFRKAFDGLDSSSYKPSTTQIEENSCQDEVS